MTRRPTLRQVLILGVVVLTAASLAACGRKGSPKEPEDAVYPRIYPYTALPVPATTKKQPDATDANPGEEPFQPPQPRRTRPDELKPPAGDSGTKP